MHVCVSVCMFGSMFINTCICMHCVCILCVYLPVVIWVCGLPQTAEHKGPRCSEGWRLAGQTECSK